MGTVLNTHLYARGTRCFPSAYCNGSCTPETNNSPDALDEGLKARDDRPEIQVDDPGASKLIAARDDMMNLLKQYSNVLGQNNLEEIEKAFDDYIGKFCQVALG